MYSSERPGERGPVIAIVGGGASGTLTAVHLLRIAAAGHGGARIALIDGAGRHGLGQAYSTTHPGHLLNSPTGTMTALAGDPGHLLRWARAQGTAAETFLPRAVYGRYLCDTLAQAQRAAHPAATLRLITSQVVAIRDGAPRHPLRLHLAADGHIDADIAVLATGNLPPATPCPVPDSPRYIPDPWAPGVLRRAGDGRPVVVLGTGLTTMDVAIAVTDASPDAVVHAVSRHALLPRAHRHGPPAGAAVWLPAMSAGGPVRLSELMWQVRTAVAEHPGNWQEIVDALRPHVPRLWQQLPPADQRLFLRHVARYWEVHRHRMPPETTARIAALRCTGRLSVLDGNVSAVSEVPGGLRVRVERGAAATDLVAGWVVNATGPARDISATQDPLLRDLLGRGLARPDPTRLGIDADPGGAVLEKSGRPSSTIFTLGPPLRGIRYETTAIPEIREQAAALARRVNRAWHTQPRPVSAA